MNGDGGKGTVLIVDDEREIADLVAVYLEAEGYQTQVRYDAAVCARGGRRPRHRHRPSRAGRHAARHERLPSVPRDPQNPPLADHHADGARR